MKKKTKDYILTQAQAKTGAVFKEQVERMKAQKDYFQALEKVQPNLAKILSSYQKSDKKSGSGNPSNSGKRFITPVTLGESVVTWAIIRESQPGIKPKTLHYNLSFDSGVGFGRLSSVTPITITPPETGSDVVCDGRIGWEDLPQVENNDTDKVEFSGLYLKWQRTIPREGNYSFNISYPWMQIDVNYDLDGSGLWGLDATLYIESRVVLVISGPAGERKIIEDILPLLYADSTTWFGIRQLSGPAGGNWGDYPLSTTEGGFYAYLGETVIFYLALFIWTWAEDGVVRYSVRQFYAPSINPDSEISMSTSA